MEPQTFYGRELAFNPRNHRYTYDGHPIPSVTAILGRLNKPALIQWAANCAVDHMLDALNTPGASVEHALTEARTAHARIRDAAGDIGSELHAYARWLLSIGGDEPPLSTPEAQRCGRALDEWSWTHTLSAIGVERKIVSRKYNYAGTCDFYGHIDGKLAVLDFKTGGERIYDEAWLQTSAYELALCEELGLDPDNIWRWVVHINKKTGKVDAQKRLTSAAHTGAWLALVECDRLLRLASKEAA